MLLWDIMSQMPGTVQDISSQEKQDTRPITTASSTGMLVTEKDTGHLSVHLDVFLRRKGEENVFYTVVSCEWYQLAARRSHQSHRRSPRILREYELYCISSYVSKPALVNPLQSVLRLHCSDSHRTASFLPPSARPTWRPIGLLWSVVHRVRHVSDSGYGWLLCLCPTSGGGKSTPDSHSHL